MSAESSPAAAPAPKPSLTQRIVRELQEFAVMFLYLLIPIGLFVIHQAMFKREEGVNITASGVAFINALVLAKVMLIAEDLGLGNRWRERPLIWPIVDKSISFAVVFVVVHYLEHIIGGVLHHKTVAESVPKVGGGGALGLFATLLSLTVALVPFFAYREVGRVLGEGRLEALLFKPRDANGQPMEKV